MRFALQGAPDTSALRGVVILASMRRFPPYNLRPLIDQGGGVPSVRPPNTHRGRGLLGSRSKTPTVTPSKSPVISTRRGRAMRHRI